MGSILKEFEEYRRKIELQREEVQKRIIGLPKLLEAVFICFYSHSERNWVPISWSKDRWKRKNSHPGGIYPDYFRSQVQPHPIHTRPQALDLIRIVEQREDRTLEFHEGPLFTNLVLADEINRAHEKTRAALLEAMGEKQITLGRTTYALEEPFFVMATENPIDVEGTFMLGAAQLDRFMMKIYTESLSEEEKLSIAETHQEKAPEINQVISRDEVLGVREFIRNNILVSPEMRRDIVRIVQALGPEGGIVAPRIFISCPKGTRISFPGARGQDACLSQGKRSRHFFRRRGSGLPRPEPQNRVSICSQEFGKNREDRGVDFRAIEKVAEDGAKDAEPFRRSRLQLYSA